MTSHQKTISLPRMLDRHVRTHPVLYLVLVLLYVASFGVILPILFMDQPFSGFFMMPQDKTTVIKDLMKVNDEKYQKALVNIKQASYTPSTVAEKHRSLQGVDFLVPVVATKRVYGSQNLGYLTQVTQALKDIQNSAKNEEWKMGFFICNVFAGPGQNNETQELSKYVLVVNRFKETSPSHAIMDEFEKEKQDYGFCMEYALQHFTSPYILMLEDDAVMYTNSFHVLHSFLNSLRPGWEYLKLFYPLRWQGFGFSYQPLLDLLSIALSFGCIFSFVYFLKLYFSSQKSASHTLRRNKEVLMLLFIYGVVYGLLASMVVGRQNILELRRIFSPYFFRNVSPSDCCSPATVYTRKGTERLIEHLKSTTCSAHNPLDKVFESYRHKHDVTAYTIEPNLVKHIGLFSSIKGISVNLEEFLFL